MGRPKGSRNQKPYKGKCYYCNKTRELIMDFFLNGEKHSICKKCFATKNPPEQKKCLNCDGIFLTKTNNRICPKCTHLLRHVQHG